MDGENQSEQQDADRGAQDGKWGITGDQQTEKIDERADEDQERTEDEKSSRRRGRPVAPPARRTEGNDFPENNRHGGQGSSGPTCQKKPGRGGKDPFGHFQSQNPKFLLSRRGSNQPFPHLSKPRAYGDRTEKISGHHREQIGHSSPPFPPSRFFSKNLLHNNLRRVK